VLKFYFTGVKFYIKINFRDMEWSFNSGDNINLVVT